MRSDVVPITVARRFHDDATALQCPAAGERFMSPILCPFCEKPCPPDAKFCSACGGALHLAPCPTCGAVNDVLALTCYQCRAGLRAPAPADAPPPPRGSHARTVAALAAVALAGALGYYAYSQRVQPKQPLPTAGGSSGRIEPTTVEAAQPEPPAVPAATPAAAVPPPRPTSPALARGTAPRPERKTVDSPRPRPSAAGARRDGCTAAVAALGLCAPEAARKDAVPAAAAKAPAAAPAPERGAQECTAAVAALGLCKPAPTRKGE
jgi:hypothetical protein